MLPPLFYGFWWLVGNVLVEGQPMNASGILDLVGSLKPVERICSCCGKVMSEKDMIQKSLEAGNRFGVCKPCIPWKVE